MKASTLDIQTSPSLIKVIARLTLLGGFILGGMYAFLQLCSTVIKLIQ